MGKINSIFNFLKDYNEIRNPVITEIDKEKWSFNLSDLPQIEEIYSVYNTQDFDNEVILEVKRPVLEPCPAPDKVLNDWIEDKWNVLETESINHKEKVVIASDNKDAPPLEEYFNTNKERVLAFDNWVRKRNNWREKELPKNQGLEFYNKLFTLYSDIKKESESVELILGDGHIRWNTGTEIINHPVLLQKVQLVINPDKPSFIIKCEEIKTELYTAMIRKIQTINQMMISEIIDDIESNYYHIADILNTKKLYERLINVIDKKGKFVESFDNNFSEPMIKIEPTLYLRKRTLGYSMFINNIIEDLERNDHILLPDFFNNMIGDYKEEKVNEVVDENWNENGMDEDVLLTLPANNEQLKIIKYLNNYGAVLVQGPPGTGKTHTIANLIGHLLSQGSSVLVASHTEKALTVLKEKVYEKLQSLCISLLSSKSQKKEMDNAINEIAIKSTNLDLHESKRKIEGLENERKDLINKYREKQKELIQIRGAEYKDIIYDNETIPPIEAAKFVNSGYGKYNYITGKSIDDTMGLPLSLDELRELYSTNKFISEEEDEILNYTLPSLDLIWKTDKFTKITQKYINITNDLKGWNPKLILKDYIDKDTLREIVKTISNIENELLNMEKIQLLIIEKTINDKLYSKFWVSIDEEFNDLLKGYEEYRKNIFDNEFEIPESMITEDSLAILNEIIESNSDIPVNKITGILKPKWKKLKNSIINHKKNIEKRDDFQKANTIIKYNLKRNKLTDRINKLLSGISEEYCIDKENVEERGQYYSKKIQVSVSWYENTWIEFNMKLKNYIKNASTFEAISSIDFEKPIDSIKTLIKNTYLPDLNNKYKNQELKEISKELGTYSIQLKEYKGYGKCFNDILYAVNELNIEKYEKAYDELTKLYAKKTIYKKRYDLLQQLESKAPEWADSIKNRMGIHGGTTIPENVELAWKWNQLNNQIDRIGSIEPNSIQNEINKINESLMRNSRELAYEKSWYEKISKKTLKQTQAIEGWRQTIKQIGKLKGKNAPMLQKKARELMPYCQTAIPVWIMPLNSVVENFDPRENKFDVIIIDEASQADILALSALYLGKKIIIVGDEEQVSPENVGLNSDEINSLIEQHLKDIPNNHLYNGKTSLYDMAKSSGFQPLMLTEHFRCLPEIIEFSNQLSYNGRIKPLRDASEVTIKPAVVEYRVPNAYRDSNKVNIIEAEHIVSLICACIENEKYDKKTIGVISLLGQMQSYEIDKMLQRKLEPIEYEKRKILCGTPSQFQGDERDVIFLSVVEGPSEKGGPVRLLSEEGNNDINRKKYNVAASRAKDQLWVVHSLNPEIDLKPDDIRLRLIKYAQNPDINKDSSKIDKGESDFEKQVMKFLLNKGYKVTPQWWVGSYRIDMVIEDGGKKIALECDGDEWHTLENLSDDLKRQAILERLGWRFIRIRGSAFYRKPIETMNWVYKELDDNDIKPNYLSNDDEDMQVIPHESILLQDIKRRAEELRLKWNGQEYENPEKLTTKVIELIQSKNEKNIEASAKYSAINNKEDSLEEIKQISFGFECIPDDNNLNIKTSDDSKDKTKSNKRIIRQSYGFIANNDDTRKSTKTKTHKEETDDKKALQKPKFDFRKK